MTTGSVFCTCAKNQSCGSGPSLQCVEFCPRSGCRNVCERQLTCAQPNYALGQKVKSLETKELRQELDMTGFTKGIYLVTITANGNSTTQKIVLE